jgi:YbbR domain-containing protein
MKNNQNTNEKKTTIYEKIFYNNKLLLVFSFILAIILWAVVKVNYSEDTTREIKGVPVTLDASLAEENDYVPFYEKDKLLVDVTVSGRALDINQYSLSTDKLIIEATSGYVDSPGYKTLTLMPVLESDINIVKISPSTITVYFDRMQSAQVNVEAKLTNDMKELVGDGYTVGQLAPSVNTANVSGPATVVDNLKKVYFEATVNSDQLPLTATTEVAAQISYALDKERASQFLVCENVGTDANPATVTIPVSKVSTVPTAVKFVNQPSSFDEQPPQVKISPANVEISYTPDGEEPASFTVGTIDFRKLKDGVNKFQLTAKETDAALLYNATEETFLVSVDLRSMSSKTIDATGSNVVFLNQSDNKKYTANLRSDGLGSLTLIGPADSLEKLTADQLQIEINVSSLKTDTDIWQTVKVSNVSIRADGAGDCWVYGTYSARVRVNDK